MFFYQCNIEPNINGNKLTTGVQIANPMRAYNEKKWTDKILNLGFAWKATRYETTKQWSSEK